MFHVQLPLHMAVQLAAQKQLVIWESVHKRVDEVIQARKRIAGRTRPESSSQLLYAYAGPAAGGHIQPNSSRDKLQFYGRYDPTKE